MIRLFKDRMKLDSGATKLFYFHIEKAWNICDWLFSSEEKTKEIKILDKDRAVLLHKVSISSTYSSTYRLFVRKCFANVDEIDYRTVKVYF